MDTPKAAASRNSGHSRRDDILLSARRLVSDLGVKGMTVRELAREVGVTEGALYRHFPSKEALVEELFAGEAARLHGWLAHSLRQDAGAWEQLDSLVEGFIEYGIRETESFRLILDLHQTETMKGGQRVRLPREQFLSVLTHLERTERLRFNPPLATVLMIVGMISRLGAGARTGVVKLTRDEQVAMACRVARAIVL
ncbi:MAG: TetR/AcrR family transcriptional regulator, partial [Candidatus Wallbacteria bacterium]|nr:TetR/AcrR family transcriptional regulator [Candidatus Wallbacteria bacterium]